MKYIFLTVGLVWVMSLVQTSQSIIDAYGLTVYGEIIKIIQGLCSFIIISVLFLTNNLTLFTFYIYNYFNFFFLVILLTLLAYKRGYLKEFKFYISKLRKAYYFKKFYEYCHPLFLYALVGLITGIGQRWLLQYFAGSKQQGYFSLAYQIGSICFLFTSSMTTLITREFSIAHKENDFDKIRALYKRYIPLLYSAAAYFACFVSYNAQDLSVITGGKEFSAAALPLSIMVLYPIHQTYGQLSGALFYASNQTRLYRNIGITSMIIGLPIMFFFMAPSKYFGLNLGALGLALQMVIIQFLGVNFQLLLNCKYLKISFLFYLFHQIIVICSLFMLAIVAHSFTSIFNIANVFIYTGINGLCYTILTLLAAFFVPSLFGLSRNDTKQILNYIKNKRFKH